MGRGGNGRGQQDGDAALLAQRIVDAVGARSLSWGERVQSLWSGYGEIRRAVLVEESGTRPIVVKRVLAAEDERSAGHPRGWNTDRSHRRKLRSYQVEGQFYAAWAGQSAARVASPLWVDVTEPPWCLVLEDLDASGFGCRRNALTDRGLDACLAWLAHFHVSYLGVAAQTHGLWEAGTYWHLDTRPDELAAMPVGHELRVHAAALDARLRRCTHKTLVHGDAKIANFCFAPDEGSVAAVDFQYVGVGCGIQDVAYFLGSCLDEDECAARDGELLDVYFGHLREAARSTLSPAGLEGLEAEWRTLYPVAWADFCRFLVGWAPDHRKLHRYSERMVREGLAGLASGPEDEDKHEIHPEPTDR